MPSKAKTTQSDLPPAAPHASGAAVPGLVTWLVCAFILVLPLATTALRWASAQVAGSELTGDRAWFAVANALTLTGFPAIIGLDTFTTSGKAIILLLMLGGTLFSLIVGGLAVVRIVALPYTDRQVLTAAGFFTGVFSLAGAIPLMAAGDHPFHAFFLSVSAFANAGLVFGALPGAATWQTHLVLLPLGFIGALGLPVLMEIADWVRLRRPLSAHSRMVLTFSCAFYLLAFAISILLRITTQGAVGASLAQTAGAASVEAMNTHTLGFPFHHASELPRVMQWAIVLAMLIGGSPGGTAGGIKTTTLATLYRGVRGALKGIAPTRPVAIAAIWIGGYLLMLGATFALLLHHVPQLSADRLLFESVSALSNVGLSHELITIVSPGLDVLTAAMVAGRLAPIAVLWWMAQTARGAELAIG